MPDTVVGIDVGGTHTKGVLVSATGEILRKDTLPTPRTDTSGRLGPFVGGLVAELAHHSDLPVRRVGVAVPGLVDEARGVGAWSANLGWRDLDLIGTLSPHLPAPLTVAHDVRAGLIGEQRHGAARGRTDVCFVPLGTGLAAALLTGGRVVRGGVWTGEIGHVIAEPDGEPCACGRRGCLETLVGAAGLARRWRRASGQEGDAAEVARRVADDDPVATRIWADGVDALAAALAPIIAATGVELVVVGGGMSRAGATLLEPLTAGLRGRLGEAPVQVVRASLGDWAGALGAAALARDAEGHA